jgi:hypothetical protein
MNSTQSPFNSLRHWFQAPFQICKIRAHEPCKRLLAPKKAGTRSASSSIRRVVLLIGLFPVVASSQQPVFEIIQLHTRNADEVVRLILPFLDPDGTAAASGTELMVRTNPENMAEVRQLVEALDKKPAQFQISVVQSSRLSLAELNAATHAHLEVSGRGSSFGTSGHLYQSDSKIDGEVTQQLTTLEGKAAQFQVGQAFPVATNSIPGYGYGVDPYSAVGIGYQEATTGFAVIPRTAGKDVLVEISPWSDRFNGLGGGALATQSASTTFLAPLGKWVRFGGQDQYQQGAGSDRPGIYERTTKNTLNIYIKIDRIR